MLPALFAILLPLGLGMGAGALGVFGREVSAAVAHLNRYPLYFAFPALVFGGIAGGDFAVPRAPVFWLLPVAVLAPVALGAWLATRAVTLRREAGSIALAALFGNVAYLGLPVVQAVLGDGALGLAALGSSLLLAGSLALGPLLLARWGAERTVRRDAEREAPDGRALAAEAPPHAIESLTAGHTAGIARRLVTQPLLWAPLAGLLGRALPSEVASPLLAALAPIGKSAGPVALFVLGLFVFARRASLRRLRPADAVAMLMRLVIAPGLALGLGFGAVALGWLPREAARIMVLLSAMPTGVTAFALATELGRGEEALARAVVGSTSLAALTIPAWSALVLEL